MFSWKFLSTDDRAKCLLAARLFLAGEINWTEALHTLFKVTNSYDNSIVQSEDIDYLIGLIDSLDELSWGDDALYDPTLLNKKRSLRDEIEKKAPVEIAEMARKIVLDLESSFG